MTTALIPIPDHEPWMDDSICSQTDPDAFFPEKGGSTREAKTICWECPVRAECLEYALRNDERFGIWGGFSERERRQLKHGKPVEAAIRRTRNERGHGFACRCKDCAKDREQRTPPPAPSAPLGHGTAARYRKGCRCLPCRAANANYQRDYNAARRAATEQADSEFRALAATIAQGVHQ